SYDEQRALFFATANDTYRLGIADPADARRGCHV
ncbi:hydrolase, partial [Escherichia coli]